MGPPCDFMAEDGRAQLFRIRHHSTGSIFENPPLSDRIHCSQSCRCAITQHLVEEADHIYIYTYIHMYIYIEGKQKAKYAHHHASGWKHCLSCLSLIEKPFPARLWHQEAKHRSIGGTKAEGVHLARCCKDYHVFHPCIVLVDSTSRALHFTLSSSILIAVKYSLSRGLKPAPTLPTLPPPCPWNIGTPVCHDRTNRGQSGSQRNVFGGLYGEGTADGESTPGFACLLVASSRSHRRVVRGKSDHLW